MKPLNKPELTRLRNLFRRYTVELSVIRGDPAAIQARLVLAYLEDYAEAYSYAPRTSTIIPTNSF